MTYTYWPRIIDSALSEKLSYSGGVLVRGPKWTGKTSTCEQVAKSALYLRNPDEYAANMEAAQFRPSLLLRGDKPRLLDEWQIAPSLWDAAVTAIDKEKGAAGQFILTGSATPVNPSLIRHTGTGRIARLTMRSMSLFESKESSGEVSLEGLFTAENIEGSSPLSVEDLAYIICRGGWPDAVVHDTNHALDRAYDYIEALIENDISEASGINRNPDKARALLRSLARCSAQEASLTTIAADMSGSGTKITEKTLASYLNSLRKLFVIEEQQAWAPSLRSRTPLRSAAVWHLTDPSLAAAAMHATPEKLLDDLPTMGHLFESLCIRDLRVYIEGLSGEVFHYRDKSGLEADAIIQLADGRWGATEIKLGGIERIEEAAKNLKALEEKIDTTKTIPPSFKAIITGGKFAYRRPDGVFVVPLSCLKP